MNNIDSKKKLLIITQYYIPDITAAAYRINDMYEAIKDQYETDIITSYPHKSKQIVIKNEDNIFRVSVKSMSKNKYIKYLNEYFGFMFGSIRYSRNLRKKYDYVFVTSPPIFSLVSGYVLSKRKKAKLIVDIRDIWPDVLIDDGTLKETSMFFRVVKKLELFMYAKADILTCVSKYMAEYIESLSGKTCNVIYNGVSEQGYWKQRNRKEVKQWRSIRLFYTGNIGYFQHLEILADAIDSEIDEKFSIELIGAGTKSTCIEEKVKKSRLRSLKLQEPMNKDNLNSYIAENADALFLNLYDSKTLQKTIPSKLFDYLSFNLPIIYGIKGEGKEILDSLGCGVSFEWDSPESLNNALLELYNNYDWYFEKSQNNRAFVCENFNRRKMFAKFWTSIEEE